MGFCVTFLLLLSFFQPAETQSNLRMAWTCNKNSHRDLVMCMKRAGIFTSPRVQNAMLAVDRGDFTDSNPYQDAPQGIGWNATISAPHMHASALENLDKQLVEGGKVLDVGSGSGYLTVCFAEMVGSSGKVVGIEHIEELANKSIDNINKHHRAKLTSGQIAIVVGDGRLGHPIDGGYNAIHVGAAAEQIPKQLVDQLADGGRMLIPVGREHGNQVFLQVDKKDGEVLQKVIEHVVYVPLTSKEHQLGR